MLGLIRPVGSDRHDRRHHPAGPRLPRHPHRGPHPRGAARAGLPRRRRARAGPGRDDHRVGGRDLRRPLLRSPPRWATRCSPTSPRRSRPASTWSSSTPATTSPRRSAPATPSQATLRRQPAHDHARAERRRAGRGVRQGPLQDRPRPVLRAAQGRSRWPRRSRGYDAWATGLRRAETHNRVIAPVVGWDAKKGKVKVSPAGPLVRRAGRALHRRERRAGQPARLRRLPLHRLLALHPARRPRRGPAQRPLGRHQQDRVRDPLSDPRPTDRTADPRTTTPSVARPHRGGRADGRSRPGGPGSRKP